MVYLEAPALDGVFHALADSTRRAMVQQLAGRQCTVSELAKPHDMSLPAASKHLKVLEGAGLVRRDVRGRTHHCSLEPGPLIQANAWIREYAAFWDDRLDALDDLLSKKGGRDV